jgi:hypothetical protein
MHCLTKVGSAAVAISSSLGASGGDRYPRGSSFVCAALQPKLTAREWAMMIVLAALLFSMTVSAAGRGKCSVTRIEL